MIECPICHQTFKNEFALQGHIRLKRDSEHMVYKRQQAEKPSQEIITNSIVQPISNSPRAILENLLREKERLLIQDANDDKFLQKLENLLSKEREADEKTGKKNYNQGWHDCDRQRDEEINDVRSDARNEAAKQCQEKISVACTKVREEELQKCQQSVNAAFKQGKENNIFCHWCIDCNLGTLIEPGSTFHKNINDLFGWMGVICPNCSRRRGLSPHFHSLSYINMSNRIEYLEKELFNRDIAEKHRCDDETRRFERKMQEMKAMLLQQKKRF